MLLRFQALAITFRHVSLLSISLFLLAGFGWHSVHQNTEFHEGCGYFQNDAQTEFKWWKGRKKRSGNSLTP